MEQPRVAAKPSGGRCELCDSTLMNAADGWPVGNSTGCVESYHDGGYGSTTVPGYCGIERRQYFL